MQARHRIHVLVDDLTLYAPQTPLFQCIMQDRPKSPHLLCLQPRPWTEADQSLQEVRHPSPFVPGEAFNGLSRSGTVQHHHITHPVGTRGWSRDTTNDAVTQANPCIVCYLHPPCSKLLIYPRTNRTRLTWAGIAGALLCALRIDDTFVVELCGQSLPSVHWFWAPPLNI